jgi:Fe-S-cluster containining protein
MSSASMSFRHHPLRTELLAIYDKVDALVADISCDVSTECCQFGITGREPYPTAIERAELRLALADRGGRVPGVGADRRCPLLTADGKCSVYASRPFGCRTFFCARASAKPPRAELQALARDVLALSEKFEPRDPGPRPLTKELS